MSMIHKIREKAGFSIAELLVAILILSMVSTVVAGGIPVARDAYNKITVAANAQVLLSTAIYSLRSEISIASDIEINGDVINYRSGKNGHKSKIYIDTVQGESAKTIMIQEFLPESEDDSGQEPSSGQEPPAPRELVPGMSKDGLHVVYNNPPSPQDPVPEGSVVTIEGLTVEKNGKDCGVDAIALSIHTMK